MTENPTDPPSRREQLLTPREVASLCRVDVQTVRRWVRAGRLAATRTPGGHLRFPPAVVRAVLAEGIRSGAAEAVSA